MAEISVLDSKKKTYPITFRLPEKLVEDLKKEAENVQISLNTLANQVFERYICWERYSGKMGLIPMTRPFLKAVVKSLSNEEIKKIAHNASKDALKELVLITRGNFTLDDFVSVFNEWLRVSWMTHRYSYDAKGHHYIIYHDLNKKWSLYLSELMNAICNDLAGIKSTIAVRKDSISVSLSSNGSLSSNELPSTPMINKRKS